MQKLITSVLLIFLFFNAKAQHGTDNFISTQAAAQQYAQKFQGRSLIIFPEVREKPIKWNDSLRSNWLENNYTIKPYVFHAQPGEYFVFQVGAWAIDKDIKNVQVHFFRISEWNRNKIDCFQFIPEVICAGCNRIVCQELLCNTERIFPETLTDCFYTCSDKNAIIRIIRNRE